MDQSLKVTLIGLLGLLMVLPSMPVASAGNCTVKSRTTCKECVGQGFKCFWCASTKQCSPFKCGSKWYGFGQCKVAGNLVVIIVPVAVVGVIFLISLLYCCCCKDNYKGLRAIKRWGAGDIKNEQEKESLDAKDSASGEEQKLKHDQIRVKYGLIKDDPKHEHVDAMK